MKITVDWMVGWANNPDIEVTVDETAKAIADRRSTLPYERRGNIHRRGEGDFVQYFCTDGRPCRGTGGGVITGSLTTGKTFEYRGYWSSRAAVVNRYWPEDPVVDVTLVDVTNARYSSAVRVRTFLEYWRAQFTREQIQANEHFELAVVHAYPGAVLMPAHPVTGFKNTPRGRWRFVDPRNLEAAVRFFDEVLA